MGERLREAYRSSTGKQQRAALVAPLWEEARSTLATDAAPSSGNGAAPDDAITATAVNQAMKVTLLQALVCSFHMLSKFMPCFQLAFLASGLLASLYQASQRLGPIPQSH